MRLLAELHRLGERIKDVWLMVVVVLRKLCVVCGSYRSNGANGGSFMPQVPSFAMLHTQHTHSHIHVECDALDDSDIPTLTSSNLPGLYTSIYNTCISKNCPSRNTGFNFHRKSFQKNERERGEGI